MSNNNSTDHEKRTASDIAHSLNSSQKEKAKNLLQKHTCDAKSLLEQQTIGALCHETIEESRKSAADALCNEQMLSASALKESEFSAAGKLKDCAKNLNHKLDQKDQVISWLSGGYSVED